MAKNTIKWIVGIVIIAIIAIIIIGAVLIFTPKEGVTKETVKIGAVLPLSGGAGFLGQSAQKALILAQEQLGDTKYNYEVIFEDDKLDPKETSTASNKLINVDGVDVIISETSGSGNVVTPLAESSKVIHFGIASDINVAKGKYNFIHWTPPEEENKVFIEELQKRGIKKVAILSVNQQGERAIVDDFKNKIEGIDVEIVSDQAFNFGEKDFKTMILKAEQTDPDIYLLLAFSPELEILTKQIKELGIETPLTGIETFEFTEQPEIFEGYWYINAADPSEEYVEAYKQKYGNNPFVGSGNAYDIFNIIVGAYETAGKDKREKPTRGEIISELENMKEFSGALGQLKMLDKGIVWSGAVVREVRDGKFVTIS